MGFLQLLDLQFLSTTLKSVSLSQILLKFIVIYLTYSLSVALYNIFLHPLRSVPGPLLSRATHLYAYYHNLFGPTLTLSLPTLHTLFGPTIRTEPNTLHFSTQSAYNIIYASRDDTFTKSPRFYGAMGNTGLGAMTDPKEAKRIRYLLAPEFTRGRMLEWELQGVIVAHLERLAERLVEESVRDRESEKREGVNLLHATRSSVLDVITELGMGKSFNSVEVSGFEHPIMEMLEFSLSLIWWRMYFLLMRWVMGPMVDFCVERLGWSWVLGSFGRLRELALRTYLEAVSEEDENEKGRDEGGEGDGKTKGRELMTRRMVKEGWGKHLAVSVNLDLVAAGSDPSGGALCYGIVCVASDGEVEGRLIEELRGVWEDGRERMPGLEVLEKLPILVSSVLQIGRIHANLWTVVWSRE